MTFKVLKKLLVCCYFLICFLLSRSIYIFFLDHTNLFPKLHFDAPCRKQPFQGASMKKMCLLTITQVYGVHGGKIISGATSAAIKHTATASAQELLVLKLLKNLQILWELTLLVNRPLMVSIFTFYLFILIQYNNIYLFF